MKTILIDMDDTIENLLEAWIDCVNCRYNKDIKLSNILHWDISKDIFDISKDDIFSILYEDRFWNTVKPKEDAIIYIKKLIDDGNQIYIVTNSNYQTLKAKMDNVLFRYFPYISPEQLIICKDKHLIKGDFIVDDYEENLLSSSIKHKILFNTYRNSHNDFKEFEHNIIRAYSWEDIYHIIKSIIKHEAD